MRSPSSTPSRRSCIATRIDMSVAWFQSRYDKAGPGGTGADYINCPLTREQYEAFVDALLAGDKTAFHEWEAATPYFDGCLPIEVMAERGRETLRHGPMKPFGLTNPHQPEVKAYAVVQLRQDNKLGTLVQHGRLPDQAEARRTGRASSAPSPASPTREFARLGGAAPQHLPQFAETARRRRLRLKADAAVALRRPDHRLRGLCGIRRHRACSRAASPPPSGSARRLRLPPPTTAHGALLGHITGGHIETIDAGPRSFQPMNVNFGLFPPLARSPGDRRRRQAPARHREDHRQEAGPVRRARSPTSRPGSAGDLAGCGGMIARATSPRMNGYPDELDGRWRGDVVLKRDVFSTIERGHYRTDGGEVEAVLRRIDTVPWWAFGLALASVPARAPRACGRGQARHGAAAAVRRPAALVRGWIDGVALHLRSPKAMPPISVRPRLRCAHCIAPA